MPDRRLAAVLVLAFAVACAETEVPSRNGRDLVGYSSSGIAAPGSEWTYPRDWDRPLRPEDRALPDPEEGRYPELPADLDQRLVPHMTETELLAAMGPPDYKLTRAVSTDGDAEDWNAQVYVWHFQDSRLTSMELTRDLEVLLGIPDVNRPHPHRPDALGPTPVVVDWQLF
ncbi:MAG: hypothetical protein KDB53_04370 [Planctomycetes bacterium]|nr:hypothetical protein [Planctomycetota bacterium]